LHGEPDNCREILLALGVTSGPWQAPASRPTTIAVHDAGDVQGALIVGVHSVPTLASAVRHWLSRQRLAWDDVPMSSPTEPAVELRHVVVVGGTLAEWNAFGEAAWKERIIEYGKVAEHSGAAWLTIRPLDRVAPPHGGVPASITRVGGCTVVVDPHTDGRHRLVEAVNALRRDRVTVTDSSLAAVVNAPTQCDPDLVVILGPDTELPLALVWELAYCELVYLDVPWSDMHSQHLEAAIAEFAGRHRRFGGLD
jgi:undecaprenyl diphosphate synthase